MKLFVVSAMTLCYLCLAFVCNLSMFKSGSASLVAQGGRMPKDEYKLSTDPKKDKTKALPVLFSHLNHATKNYSVDGTAIIACVECHHTDQPAAEAIRYPPLMSAYPADRTVTLTAMTAKDPKTPAVLPCRACHARQGDELEAGAEVPRVIYEGDTDPTLLTNEEAFHRNCNSCHDAAVEKRKVVKAPTTNECAKCHSGESTSDVAPVRPIWTAQLRATAQQRAEELEAEARARLSKQVKQAAREAKEAFARYVEDLTVTTVPKPDRTKPGQNVVAYKAQAAADALSNTKATLLQGLPTERKLEGLRAYVERAFPAPSQLSVFRSGRNTFVERNVADELFAKAKETMELVDISDKEVEITINSHPDDATFKLLSFEGQEIQDVCTNGCPVRLYRGDYKYEIVRAGYKQKRFPLPLLNRAPRLKLDCRMVEVSEANEPSPCQEIAVSER